MTAFDPKLPLAQRRRARRIADIQWAAGRWTL